MIDSSIFKAFADDRLNMAEMMALLFHRIENKISEPEKKCLQAISRFPSVFSKVFYSWSLKGRLVWKRVK